MKTYKTTLHCQLWTKIGSKAGTTNVGEIIDTGESNVIKGHNTLLVLSDNYYGKYIETDGLVIYSPTPPTEQSNLVYRVEYYDDLSLIVYDKNGNVLWHSPQG